MTAEATLAQWTSGGGAKVAVWLKEIGHIRGLEVASDLGKRRDAAPAAPPAGVVPVGRGQRLAARPDYPRAS